MSDDLQVKHLEHGARAAFVLERGGERLGELTMKRAGGDGPWNIDHTQVADALKGQGAGRTLLDAAVAWARTSGAKLTATCPYAKAQFEKDASLRDVLADGQ